MIWRHLFRLTVSLALALCVCGLGASVFGYDITQPPPQPDVWTGLAVFVGVAIYFVLHPLWQWLE